MARPTPAVARPRIAFYRRVSTPAQAEKEAPLDLQLAKCREAADRIYGEGLYDRDDFVDKGFSGTLGLRSQDSRKKGHRPGLSDMVDRIVEGEYDAVVVYRLDRLFRSVSLAVHLLKVLRDHDAHLVSAMEPMIDATTPYNRAMLMVMVIMAEYFLEWSSDNIQEALRKIRAEGRFLGVPPYGWRRPTEEEQADGVTTSLLRDGDRGRWVVQMKDWSLDGLGTRSIVKALHDAGVPTAKGKEWWQQGTVMRTLQNPAHAGLMEVGDGTLVQGDFHELRYYDESVYHQIQEKLRERAAKARPDLGAPQYLLNDLLTCGNCGGRMRGRRAHHSGKLYYRCTTPLHKRGKLCGNNSKEALVIEECAVRAVGELAQRDDIRELAEREARKLLEAEDEQLEAEVARLQREVDRTQGELDRWADLYGRGDISQDYLADQARRLQERKEGLETTLAERRKRLERRETRSKQLEDACQRLRSFPEVWERLGMEERVELLASATDGIVVTKKEDGETHVVVKLVFGDEREFHIPRLNRATRGPLSVRQLAYVELAHQGLSLEQMAERLDVSVPCARTSLRKALKALGVSGTREAYEQCREEIERYRDWLPLAGRVRRDGHEKPSIDLTETQKQVLVLCAKGTTAATIARQLNISINTVYVHLRNIRERMGARDDRQAAEKAIRFGLVELDEPLQLRLSPRELAYLHLRREGVSDQEIAEKWEVSLGSVRQYRDRALERSGVATVEEAIERAADLIARDLPGLPLGPLCHTAKPSQELSEATLRVLRLKADGKSYTQIGATLGITKTTVSYHVQRAKRILGVDKLDEVIAEAKNRGLI